MRKLCETLRQAMEQAGLRDGMTISFHHHLRNGDYVLNMVLDEAAKMGVKDLTVNASSVLTATSRCSTTSETALLLGWKRITLHRALAGS